MQQLTRDPGLYEIDFLAWIEHQVDLLRAGRLDRLDVAHIAEELEDMGKNLRRELRSRLRVLVAHLLKREHQPSRRTRGCDATIVAQRIEIADLLEANPSLRPTLPAALEAVYPAAVKTAAAETGLAADSFAERLPYSLEQVLDGGGEAATLPRRRRSGRRKHD